MSRTSVTPGHGLMGRYLLRVYLPLVVLIWIAIRAALWLEQDAVEHRMGDAGAAELQVMESVWQDKLAGMVEDLRILMDHQELVAWLRAGDAASREQLKLAWYYFTASKRTYDQVRFIDTDGIEHVRINYGEGGAVIAPDKSLARKSDRYYIKESQHLGEGEVYVSELDLNVEKGRVEKPFKPMLRFATPVFIDGEERGLVVINALARNLLGHRTKVERRVPGKLMILNEEGYYLRGLNENQEWGFMFPGTRRDQRLQDHLPGIWARLRQAPAGILSDKGDIYAFRRVVFPVEKIEGLMPRPTREWFLMLRIDQAEIAQSMVLGRKISIIIGFGISLLTLIFVLLYAKVAQAKQNHLKSASDLGTRLRAVMDTVPDAILTFDETGRVETFNAATLKIFDCSEDWLGRTRLAELMPEGVAELSVLLKGNFTREDGSLLSIRREFIARRESGEWFPLELTLTETEGDGRRLFIGIARDITDRKAVEEQIQRRALYDDLTSLPNRILLRTKMDSMISLAQRHKMHGAVLFMDLDNFKTINDSMGHMAGDVLLCRVAERLTRSLRSEDIVSRLGGDEFVVVLPMLGDDHQASTTARDVAEKLRQALNQPVMLEGHEYVITPSIGVVLFPSEGMNADDLLRQADTAMYRAKAAGRNTIRFFHPSMQAEVNDRLRVGKELRLAVEQGQLELYLQPQVDAQYACVVGAEALIRWNHPVRGLLGPGAFIPHAEELGMIAEVGEWTLREGFTILQRLLRELPCQGLECLAINLSPRHFRSPSFLPRLRALMEEFHIPMHRIELEITENLLLEDLEEAVDKMAAIKEMGIRFALDDFGTGFSSLAYLKRLPVGRLKIDRSFISGVHNDAHNAAIVETILAMARVQQLAVTAEGVEQEEEKEWLMARGCAQIQGFLYSRPLRLADFMRYCRELDGGRLQPRERERI